MSDGQELTQPKNKPVEYLSMVQAARLSGYHPDYLGQLAREGKLKATKYGHNWITTSDAVNEFIASENRKKREFPVKQSVPDPILTPTESFLAKRKDEIQGYTLHSHVSEEELPHNPTTPMNI